MSNTFNRKFSTSRQLFRLVRKVYAPNPQKLAKIQHVNNVSVNDKRSRINEIGIQMLPQAIYDQVFLNSELSDSDPVILERCKINFNKLNINPVTTKFLPDVDFKLPPLKGKNVIEHFFNIAEEQAKPYRDLVLKLLEGVPEKPAKWVFQKGWTRYAPGKDPEIVDYPLEQALVFDVEVCVMCGKAPTLATAVSNKAWYGWVSETLINAADKPVIPHNYSVESLIPLESNDESSKNKDKIIIGHNVSYDRARIKEQYYLNRSGIRFLDTMSLHISISGITSYQRVLLKSKKTEEEDEDWKNISSLNSLVEVYKLYCNKSLTKSTRDIFLEGTLTDIKNDFQKAMRYCSGDVTATYEILLKLFPLFLERFPHPATFAGILELSTAYLPVNKNWNRYLENCDQSYEDLDNERKARLIRRADHACHLFHNEKYKEDLWMWDQDWDIKDIKLKKTPTDKVEEKTIKDDYEELAFYQKKFNYLWSNSYLSKIKTLLPGYPNWYRKLCTKPNAHPDWVPGPHLISTSMQITPKILRLTWEGYPLHFIREKGWGFLVPFSDDIDIERKLPLENLLKKCPLPTEKPKEAHTLDLNIDASVQQYLMRKEFYSRVKKDKTGNLYKGTGVWCNMEVEDCCFFFKLPHKNGDAYNVGNPLSKDFLNKFSENVLAGDTESAEHVLTIARMLSYWRNNRDRLYQQFVVWLDDKYLPKNLHNLDLGYGAILPSVVVCGTLTRRAVEPTWMTASNAHYERVGSELRGMVQAPTGYSIVGADVDSQELWIASLIGDAAFGKIHGGTPFGWMTLSGNKSEGTDMHSVTAKAVGISRDHAKVINYARIYGAGQNFAERLLKQYNPTISDGEAKIKALKMFEMTKGKRIFFLKKEFLLDYPDKAYGKWQAFELARVCGKTVEEMFTKPRWVGGTESDMFNRLEEIASTPEPTTPFLGCRLSRSLEPKSIRDDKYLPTRINWVVQSGAVDFLHLMLVSMNWLMGNKSRFCLSFHDEIRYLVPDEYKYRAALAMHVTNLLTRAFCAQKMGLNDLPLSVAFFSSVEVDTVLRKDSKDDCKTPSNPHGLEKGYGVANGETLDIYEAIRKCAAQYSYWYK